MNLCELVVKYPLRCFAGACLILGFTMSIAQIIMAPAMIYAETLAEKRCGKESTSEEEKKSD